MQAAITVSGETVEILENRSSFFGNCNSKNHAVYFNAHEVLHANSRIASDGAFALGKSPDGHSVVIAADDAFGQFGLETGNPKRRWSTPRSVGFLDVQQKVVANEKLFTQVLAGNLFVGLRSKHCSKKVEAPDQFWEAIAAGIGLALTPSHWRSGAKVAPRHKSFQTPLVEYFQISTRPGRCN